MAVVATPLKVVAKTVANLVLPEPKLRVLFASGSKLPANATLPSAAIDPAPETCASTYALVATPVAAVGLPLSTNSLPVAPSTVITVVVTPPSLTLKRMSPLLVTLLKVTSEPLTPIVKSLSAPTTSPVSFSTLRTPLVESLALLLRKFAADVPPSASASVAVPVNLAPVTLELNWIPGAIVAKPVTEVLE